MLAHPHGVEAVAFSTGDYFAQIFGRGVYATRSGRDHSEFHVHLHSCMIGSHTTGNHQQVPGHIIGLVRQEKRHRIGHLLGFSTAADRNGCQQLSLYVLRNCIDSWCSGEADGDGLTRKPSTANARAADDVRAFSAALEAP